MADPLTFAFTRCLIELGLASNAPTTIKTQVRVLSSICPLLMLTSGPGTANLAREFV